MRNELRGEDDVLPPARERLPQQLLVAPGTVDLGRVEDRDAEVERAMDRRDRLGLVGGAVGLAHPHAPEPESRDLEAARSELSLWQRRIHFTRFPESEGSLSPAFQTTETMTNSVRPVTIISSFDGDTTASRVFPWDLPRASLVLPKEVPAPEMTPLQVQFWKER